MTKYNITMLVWDASTREDVINFDNVVLPKGLTASLLRALADEIDPPKSPEKPRFYTSNSNTITADSVTCSRIASEPDTTGQIHE